MNIEDFYNYCLEKPFVEETFPFGGDTLVFKVKSKMFALCDINNFNYVNLKCNPERALQLREEYEGVEPGYHMNKVHWNSVFRDRDISDQLFYELIDHSFELVVKSLPKKQQFER